MSRHVTVRQGWLSIELNRASEQAKEWSSRPLTKAQVERARERDAHRESVDSSKAENKNESK